MSQAGGSFGSIQRTTTTTTTTSWLGSLSWLGVLMMMMMMMFGSVTAAAAATPNVPVFAMNDLLPDNNSGGSSSRRDEELSDILQTTGVLAIALPPPHHQTTTTTHRVTALSGLCRCLETLPQAQPTLLLGQETMRHTLATATVGRDAPLPLPDGLETTCGQDVFEAMEQMRDQVAAVTYGFVQALDRLLLGNHHDLPPVLLRNVHNGTYHSVASIQAAANHLEHFHVYEKEHDDAPPDNSPTTATTTTTADWHTDAGLFLSFVPALNCHDVAVADDSFLLPTGAPAVFPENAVIIMLGAGAQHWLHTSPGHSLQATRHTVRMAPGHKRAWYGMMTLVPDSAIVQEQPQPKTFADMKQHMTLSFSKKQQQQQEGDNDDEPSLADSSSSSRRSISIGCGVEEVAAPAAEREEPWSSASTTSSPRPRRRLQHVQHPSECNNVTNFFCWMQCLDIPNAAELDGYLNSGFGLYCLDPAILATSGNQVPPAAAPCESGWTHNAACTGQWAPTSVLVPGYEFGNRSHQSQAEVQFCYGGTSMYMDGFHWLDTTCVIVLFEEWTLTSAGQLAAACVGTLLVGALLELIILGRRRTAKHLAGHSRLMRLTVSGLLYGLQLTLGYFIMLIVMTYSGPLFLCTILGLVSGHVLFNSKDALLLNNKPRPKAEAVPEASTDGSSKADGGECCCPPPTEQLPRDEESGDDNDEDDAEAHEGITPCCK